MRKTGPKNSTDDVTRCTHDSSRPNVTTDTTRFGAAAPASMPPDNVCRSHLSALDPGGKRDDQPSPLRPASAPESGWEPPSSEAPTPASQANSSELGGGNSLAADGHRGAGPSHSTEPALAMPSPRPSVLIRNPTNRYHGH